MEWKYLISIPGILKILEMLTNIVVFSLVESMSFDKYFIETTISRALFAAAITGFLATLALIVARISNAEGNIPLRIIELCVAISLFIFNIVSASFAIDEYRDLKKITIFDDFFNVGRYLIAACIALGTGVLYIVDGVISFKTTSDD